MCTKRAGSGGEDDESESGRLRIQERQTRLMNVELRTGVGDLEQEAESGGGCIYKSERLIMRLRTSCRECWAKGRRLRAMRSVAERLRLKRRVPGE